MSYFFTAHEFRYLGNTGIDVELADVRLRALSIFGLLYHKVSISEAGDLWKMRDGDDLMEL